MIKRAFDIVVAVSVLVVLSPAYVVLVILIRKKMGSPVLFRQTRPGKDGELFEIVKFRTMVDAVDSEGNRLPDEDCLTPFGIKLRNSSLDELPELFNVLAGEMSIVGPRPLLTEYLPLYSEEQARRHEVRPGITGWAQVNGRNTISWKKKFALDVWYVDNQSIWLDIQILWMTVLKVIDRSGIDDEKGVGQEKFTGNKE